MVNTITRFGCAADGREATRCSSRREEALIKFGIRNSEFGIGQSFLTSAELPGGCSAGVLACECTGRPARCSCWRRDAAATRSRDGCATRLMGARRFPSREGSGVGCFVQSPLFLLDLLTDHEPILTPSHEESLHSVVWSPESLHDFDAAHWDHELQTSRIVPPTGCCRRLVGRAALGFLCRQDAGSTLPGSWRAPFRFFACIGAMNRWPCRAGRKAPINRTHSKRFARFGDARQSRSVWSACVFSAAFPRQAATRWPVGSWKASTTLMPRIGTMNFKRVE